MEETQSLAQLCASIYGWLDKPLFSHDVCSARVERLIQDTLLSCNLHWILQPSPCEVTSRMIAIDFHCRDAEMIVNLLFWVMQNLVDSLAQRFDDPVPVSQHSDLETFVVYNKRRRVTSSAKRKLKPGSTSLSQTPDGSFRDLMLNARDLLQHCGFFSLPAVCSLSLAGPSLMAL